MRNGFGLIQKSPGKRGFFVSDFPRGTYRACCQETLTHPERPGVL